MSTQRGAAGSDLVEIRLAPEQIADLVAGGVTVIAAGSPLRLVPDFGAAAASRALVDATTVAEAIGMSAAWVREHADELGAVRMGDGPRPRLRFDLDRAREAWAARSARERPQQPTTALQPAPRRRNASSKGTDVELLPIQPVGGRRAA